ncbi:MAG: ribonuclease H-like domain-containing protein [Acidobacteriia bacterium]|nr:ribonuclease H-like domain-containing protein [Terriglobia bacterium]
MSDLQQQLADLRARVARAAKQCDAKYDVASASRFSTPHALSEISQPTWQEEPVEHEITEQQTAERAQTAVEGWLGGETIETAHGSHFETEKLYERHRRHGSADIGSLAELPEDLLTAISGGAAPLTPPSDWAFLDTETTGLAGGSGTCAFLVGIGRITPEGFRVRQFFMRDYCEEASLLDAVARHLEPFRVLITYNGRSFDQPLLETRYRLNRSRPPFGKLEHLDLLYGARRLWKLRYESCRLVDLESQVLGFERNGDVPGALIPYLYFEYLRTGRAARLLPVFHHNATDILTLACLTGIVPLAFKDPGNLPFRHGAEIAGIARWLREAGDLEQARALFRRAIHAGMPDELMFRTLWDVAAIERKLGADEEAVTIWNDLAAVRNAFRIPALEELAKHYEHRQKDLARALETTRAALDHEETPALRRREQRLARRMATRPKTGGRKARSTVKRRRLL